mmetsp:Transcript_19067/g.53372  ORF Transcript_19067/g.53372 Transcript_19067/m.53372 type:complete len:90 (+) Transcript_19067:195-464(+)
MAHTKPQDKLHAAQRANTIMVTCSSASAITFHSWSTLTAKTKPSFVTIHRLQPRLTHEPLIDVRHIFFILTEWALPGTLLIRELPDILA